VLFLCLLVVAAGVVRSCSRATRAIIGSSYTIARDPTWYPINMVGKEKAILAFSNDLLTEIAKKEGLKFQLIAATSYTLFEDLKDGRFDAVLTSLMPTPVNRTRYLFSEPFFKIGSVLILPKREEFVSLDQMKGKVVGVRRGSSIVFDVNQYQIVFSPYDNMSRAFDDLENKRIDGILLPAFEAYLHTRIFYPEIGRVVTAPLSPEALRLVSKKGMAQERLVKKFNSALIQLKEEGTYDELLKKWGLLNPEKPHDNKSETP